MKIPRDVEQDIKLLTYRNAPYSYCCRCQKLIPDTTLTPNGICPYCTHNKILMGTVFMRYYAGVVTGDMNILNVPTDVFIWITP